MVIKSKFWCFTANNYTEKDEEVFRSLEKICTYGICAKEVGENGTPHLQGYFELRNRKLLTSIKKIVGGWHLEARKGTAQEASDYCKKDGDFVEFGEVSKSQSGRRTDLEEIRGKIKDGVPEEEIAEAHFSQWCIYRRSFSAYKSLIRSKESRPDLKVFVIYGEPGTGKTRYVFTKHNNVYICPDPTLTWFDGYDGEEVVLIDDYRGDGKSAFLLRLLDIYPLQVPVKGGFVDWKPKIIFLTSNMEVPFGHYDIDAPLKRRIKKTVKFTSSLDFDNPKMMEKIDGYFN